MKYIKYNFEHLEVFELAIKLVEEIYIVTKEFPREEIFGLTSQIRRAVISVVLNIAEGSARGSKKDFARFIRQSLGSLVETKAGLLIAVRLGFLSEERFSSLTPRIDELFYKLNAFLKSLGTSVK